VELVVPQPKAVEDYYASCGKIDRHNHHRMKTLCLERKLGTKEWLTRVNMSVVGMIVVDAWLAFSGCMQTKEVHKDFYASLAEELIDDLYNLVGGGRALGANHEQIPALSRATGAPRSGIYAHLTPMKKRRKPRLGNVTKQRLQGKCRVCQKKTTSYVCSQCQDEKPGKEALICHTENEAMCYSTHMELAMELTHGV
jgi:hypothetical protein